MTKVKLTAILFLLASAHSSLAAQAPPPSEPIQYIRKLPPEITIPDYAGSRYQATVPDTFDPAERIKLTIHGLIGPTDPKCDYEIYWWANFFHNPPVMDHTWSDQCQVKFMEALPLLRNAVGATSNQEVDQAWMNMLLKSIGPDGLFYYPMRGRPWGRIGYAWAPPVWTPSGKSIEVTDPAVEQWASAFNCARLIGAMTVYYQRDHNPLWKQTIEKMINRFHELKVTRGEDTFLPNGVFLPNARVDPATAETPTGILAVECGGGRIIQALAQYHRVTSYEPARALAEKLTNHLRYHAKVFDDQGRFLMSPDERGWLKATYNVDTPFGGHFHAHTIALLSMLDYALAVDDRDLLQFIRKSFEWARTQGSAKIGFFPEMLVPDYPSAEICEIADMIAIATKLSAAGIGDYWDDVDRWSRNQFCEQQLTTTTYVNRISAHEPVGKVEFNQTVEAVAERNLGAFGGWASANEWLVPSSANKNDSRGIMHCCTGNAARAFYYLWNNIMSFDESTLQVHLLMNAATAWADMNSYLPYTGKVELTAKQSIKTLRVRMPEWVKSRDKIEVSLDGKAMNFRWDGRYIVSDDLHRWKKIEIKFPIHESQVTEKIGKERVTLYFKGNTVYRVDPPGKICPIYQREQYRGHVAPMKAVSRFVPKQSIAW